MSSYDKKREKKNHMFGRRTANRIRLLIIIWIWMWESVSKSKKHLDNSCYEMSSLAFYTEINWLSPQYYRENKSLVGIETSLDVNDKKIALKKSGKKWNREKQKKKNKAERITERHRMQQLKAQNHLGISRNSNTSTVVSTAFDMPLAFRHYDNILRPSVLWEFMYRWRNQHRRNTRTHISCIWAFRWIGSFLHRSFSFSHTNTNTLSSSSSLYTLFFRARRTFTILQKRNYIYHIQQLLITQQIEAVKKQQQQQ